MQDDEPFIRLCREVVRMTPRSALTDELKKRADALHEAYDLLKISCTLNTAREFTAALTRTYVALEAVKGNTPQPPKSGVNELEASVDVKTGTG